MEYYKKYYQGYFWLPGKLDDKFVATLYINNDGAIQLMTLKPIVYSKSEIYKCSREKIDILYGYIKHFEDSTSYSIKIYDLWNNSGSSSLGFHFLESFGYFSKQGFIREKIDGNIEDEDYKELMLSSSKLREWIEETGLDFKGSSSDEYEITSHYKQPKEINLYQNSSKRIYIFFRANHSFSAERHQTIKEEPFINIEFSKKQNLKELFKIRQSLNRLLSVILDIPFYSSEVDAHTNSKKSYRYLNRDNKTISRLSIPTDYKVFIINSTAIFKNWEAKQEKLDLFIKNFFSVYGQKGVLPEIKFITYCSVIENYHKNSIKKKSDFIDRIKYMIGKSFLSSQIDDIEKLSEKIKTTRNYHVHLEEKHKDKSFESLVLFDVNLILEFLIREILLKEIGLVEAIPIDHPQKKALNKINKLIIE